MLESKIPSLKDINNLSGSVISIQYLEEGNGLGFFWRHLYNQTLKKIASKSEKHYISILIVNLNVKG